jgi:hypothetical protein
MAVEAGKSLVWDWDIQADSNRLFGDLQTILGLPASTFHESAEDFRHGCIQMTGKSRRGLRTRPDIGWRRMLRSFA